MNFVFSIILFLLISHQPMSAQNITGEYHLQGVQDAAGGFRFTKEGTFEFFFIYGAVDRTATGKYSVENNVIKLDSDKEPGNDFAITSQLKNGQGYTIQVSDPNTYLLRNIICIYFIQGKENVTYSDDNGKISIDADLVDKIMLVHELFPDIPSTIKDESNHNNQFEVRLSPSLGMVSFEGIDLTIDGKKLTCLPNYVLPFQHVSFVKQ